jgi:hypothetical protein
LPSLYMIRIRFVSFGSVAYNNGTRRSTSKSAVELPLLTCIIIHHDQCFFTLIMGRSYHFSGLGASDRSEVSPPSSRMWIAYSATRLNRVKFVVMLTKKLVAVWC